jgi:predicted GH43/DUF377 family glycosyl hydrolase
MIKLLKSELNPILMPKPENDWENLVVCNPGVWYEKGKFYMLYRAAGNDRNHVIRFGLATSTDGVHFTRVGDKPVFGPSENGEDAGGVEDPRIIKLDDYFYVTYAFRPCPPGQYWTFRHDEVVTQDFGPNAPLFLKNNIANSGLAITKDFHSWRRLGRLTDSDLDDRDVIIFPEKVHGKFVMIHRPKEWVGERYGTNYPGVWIRYSEDILTWKEPSKLLLKGIEGTWEEKVGGSTPPMKVDGGWLMLYHGVEDGGKGYYRVGAALLSADNPSIVLGRTKEPILEPEYDYETKGIYNGCVFPTGSVIVDGTLYVYYGAADKCIGVATCGVDELVDSILAE